MGDLNVVDHFLQTFITYIDSGFGFLQGDVKALTTILIGIDITMAGLFWAFDGDAMLLARLIKKVLYVGAFALILNNFTVLAGTIFKSFAGLGLNAAHSGMTADDLLKPGKLAGAGFTAAWPLLEQAGKLVGFTSFLDHFITIIVLIFAWIVVVLSFFLLAVQLFVTILEFKLTSLAGFVLVPFALWNKTSFLAERVLGHVVTSGIKVMVLAVIVGIGTTYFGTFTSALGGRPIGLADAMSLVLAALSLFGLGIFGPAIATGLVSGAPQLGAGAVLGTGSALVATGMIAGGGARMLGGAGIAAVRAGTALGSGAATAYGLGQAASGASGMAGVGAGLSGVAKAGAGAARNAFSGVGAKFAESAQAGRQAAFRATGGKIGGGGAAQEAPPDAPGGMPKWAKRLQGEQRTRARIQGVTQAIREGDRPGGSAMPNLKEEGN
jgi:type IV secretion system protein TrbL